MSKQSIKPSRWYYLIPVVLFLVAMTVPSLFVINFLQKQESRLTRVVVPGTKEIRLAEPGEYQINYEYKSVVGNRTYSTEEELPGIEVNLVSKETGKKLELNPASMGSSYTSGRHEGKSLFEFKIDQPGTYELSARYTKAGKKKPEFVLAVGQDFLKEIFLMMLMVFVLSFGSIILAIVSGIAVFAKRRKAKKALETAAN